MQMSKNKCQFIINLVKLPNGYAFDSVIEPQISAPKKKNTKKPGVANSTSKSMNRIARQLALDLQQPSERPPTVTEVNQHYSPPHEVEVQEQIQVDIRRQNQLPSLSISWYDQTKIHDIEKSAFPQFFGSSAVKPQNLYAKYRNFMVNMYQKNPNQYLTKITCRRILRGDVSTIMKIHSFLEKESLINFGVSKDGNYTFVPSIFSKVLNPQIKYPNPTEKMIDKDEEETHQSVDLTNLTITLVNKNFSKGNRVYCSSCGIICGLIWYIRREDSLEKVQNCLCCECYQDLPEKEMEGYIKNDIVKKVESTSSKQLNHGLRENKPMWNIEENLKLLNFFSNPETKDWDELKLQYDNKKSLDDIILQFMQFPISNFNEEQKPKTSKLNYSHDIYINRLVNRLNDSKYAEDRLLQSNNNLQEMQENKYKQMKFQNEMQQIFSKLFQKYRTKINYQMKRQDYLNKLLNEVKAEVQYRKQSLISQVYTRKQLELNGNQPINEMEGQFSQKNIKKIRKRSRRIDQGDSYSDQSSSSISNEDEQNQEDLLDKDDDNNYEGEDNGEHEESHLNEMMGDICSG